MSPRLMRRAAVVALLAGALLIAATLWPMLAAAQTPPPPPAPAPAPVLWCKSTTTCPPEAPPEAPGEVWEVVAGENGTVQPAPGGPYRVRYGAGALQTEKTLPGPTVACTNAVFGDSAYGIYKSCRMLAGTWVKPPPPPLPAPPPPAPPPTAASPPAVAAPPATWVKCADEGSTCSRNETTRREVRYGSGTVWLSRVVDLGVIPCVDSAWSATPVPGTVKACWYDSVDTTAALSAPVPQPVIVNPPVPPPATPPEPAPVLPSPVPVVTATGPPPVPVLCWPSAIMGVTVPGATGPPLYWGSVGEAGDWYGWRCPVEASPGNVRLVVKVVRKNFKTQSLATLVNEALRYPRLIDALEAMWNKYDVPCEALEPPETVAACAADMQALAAAAITTLAPPPAPPPSPTPTPSTAPAWVVAPYALSKTTPPSRPVFGFRAGRRVAQTYTFAEVGQPCRPEVASVTEGAVNYAAFGPAFNPGEVTVCVRK